MDDANTPKKQGLEDNFGRDVLSVVDDSVVFSVSKNTESHEHRHRHSHSHEHEHRSSKNKKVIIAIIAVLAACVIAAAIYFIVSRQGGGDARKRSAASFATLDEAFSTEPVPSGVVSGTGIAGLLSREEVLMDYAQKNNIISVLEAQTDGNMSLDVTADKNALIVRYSVRGSAQDENMRDYVGALPKALDELCLRMNGTVHTMRQNSGVPNAMLYIGAVDQNGVTLYSRKVTGAPIEPTTEPTDAGEQTTVPTTVPVRRSTNGRPPVPTRGSSNGARSAATQQPTTIARETTPNSAVR